MSDSPSFPTLPANAFFFLCVWCSVRFCYSPVGLSHKTQVLEKRRGSRPMEICWELCLTKCSNIIVSSRISTHASKVHLLSLCFSLPFSPLLSTVAGVGWFPWWPFVQHNLGHWISHSGAADWQLWQEMCYLTHCVMNFTNKNSCYVCLISKNGNCAWTKCILTD